VVKKRERQKRKSFLKPAPRTWILQRNYGLVNSATLDETIFIREKTVHYCGTPRGEERVEVGYMTKN
jgi:hypothetical protein